MAAGTCTYIARHVIELSTNRTIRTTGAGASFSWARISAVHGSGVSPTREVAAQGPSCIFVGPIETASQETLEALYRQARDAYYSGKPLIVDDMFDRVEAFALASIWILFLAIGSSACALPIFYTIGLAYQDAFGSGVSHGSQAPIIGFLATVNGILFMAAGSLIGYPIASASVKVLQGLWRNDLVALKGACPNCGEEVFAFVRSDQSNNSPHRADCHVCESLLEFRTKVEQTISKVGRRWVHGRVYLVSWRRQRWKND